ncbi:MAG: 16S rRNA (cytosine(1402)-N(4))-methyltransferase RsmH [Clostridiales bacterium]|nr:16S rRNA (cytosine(1402)-N(4))-methyltransferase RsmH [Clostridiales bacterium]
MHAGGFAHTPVMPAEVIDALQVKPGGVYADGTLGGGGHAGLILHAAQPGGTLYGIDRDPAALAAAGERLGHVPGFRAMHGNFHDVKALLAGVALDGGLLDLGVSSHQLDTPERGFSYHEEAPLDMRMDPTRGMTAAQWLAQVTEKEFAQALYDYADERWAARIAKVLMEMRAQQPLTTTGDLVALVDRAIPKAVRQRDQGHPARRTFQAVRIAVNDELQPLRQALEDWVSLLNPGGRLCVITFHSIEDRIVKRAFHAMQHPCVCPPQAPVCTCGRQPMGRVLFGGAVKPGKAETEDNPRARSAILRAVEKR